MKADIRFQEILKKVNDQGRVLIADLAESLKVSEMTVRRDIEHLSRLGMLRREKGFAIKGVSGSFEPAFAIRSEIAQKQRVILLSVWRILLMIVKQLFLMEVLRE